ncbi:MAG: glycosyltransferase family 4 protein [Alphaproteobacteria bacterium]|nr:glycosyltransferase family 4 protein [Alphaproteobacteria bacterium]
MNNGPVLFLFKSGRKARLAENGPREFFYGFTEMARLGIEAELLEEDDLPLPSLGGALAHDRLTPGHPGDAELNVNRSLTQISSADSRLQSKPFIGFDFRRSALERLATRLLDPLAALNAATLARLSTKETLSKLNAAQAIVATTNAHGLALGFLKWRGLLAPPVLLLPMGVWPLKVNPLRRRLLGRWLRELSLAPISKAEADWLKARLDPFSDVSYLPFGTDVDFWSSPQEEGSEDDGALAIGNDPHRDWACLSSAWMPDLLPLTIVTRRQVPPAQGAVRVLAGDWNERPISDCGIRDLYHRSRFVIIPIKDTIQPSGQSACLQAMSMGKAVILSRIAGLWDNELLKDGETCLLVPPGDAQALAQAVRRLQADPGLVSRLGTTAREIVKRRFTIERMGEALAAKLHVLLAQAPTR